MIRATRSSLVDLIRRETAMQSNLLGEVQAQAITGRKLQRPSDDPVAIVAAQRMSSVVADQDVWAANAELAVSAQDVADSALANVNDILVRARELAVAMAGDTVDARARATAAIEARGLQDALTSAANTQFDGRYLFSGASWDTASFAADGTYGGDTFEPTARVGEDRWVQIAFDGSAIFAGTADVFGTLEALAVALETNDAAGVGTTLDSLEDATDQVSNARGGIGVQTQIAEDASRVAGALGVVFGERLSALTVANQVETYTRLNELQSAYESTLQVAASTTTKSLLDYLG